MNDTNDAEAISRAAQGVQAAGAAARRLGEQAGRAGADAVKQARDVGDEARTTGASLAGDAGEHLQSAAESGKNSLADQIDHAARALHRSGTELEDQQDWAAHLVERGAAELGSLAETLRSNDLRGLMRGLQDLANRQPALFTGASLAAGFALARVGRVAVSEMSKGDLPHLPETVHGQ